MVHVSAMVPMEDGRMSTTDRFHVWKRQVDVALYKTCGLTSDDLMDVDYYTWFEDGVTPIRAARKAIKANMV